jgi:hypothetical protein
MTDKKELAICKRRGHNAPSYGGGWAQCKWCGIWLRTVQTVEEREDEPPESEMDPGVRADRQMARLKGEIRQISIVPPPKKRPTK